LFLKSDSDKDNLEFKDNQPICYNNQNYIKRFIGGNMTYKTVQQVADELQLSVITIRRKIRSGELKAYTVGKSYRIADEDIEKFIKGDNNGI
jgi:excisionase family DNA binding protein